MGSQPVLFKKTVMRAAVRKMLVRVRGVDGGSFVVSSKDCAVEVLRDTGNDLQLLFEECTFGTMWALHALPLDMLAQHQMETLPPWLQCKGCAQDLLLATSDSGILSVLHINATRRRLVCIEQVQLPRAAVFNQLWSGQSAAHSEPRRVYGHYLCVHASGTAIAVASLHHKVAVLPVLDVVQHGRLFALDDSADVLHRPYPSAPVAKVITCVSENTHQVYIHAYTHTHTNVRER